MTPPLLLLAFALLALAGLLIVAAFAAPHFWRRALHQLSAAAAILSLAAFVAHTIVRLWGGP